MMRPNYNPTSDDMASIGRAVVEAITELRKSIDTLTDLFGVVQTTGLFTMAAANTFAVLNPNAVAGSIILLQPVNAAAATLQSGASALYVNRAATVAGTSFTVLTANAAAAVGTEQFAYALINPLT